MSVNWHPAVIVEVASMHKARRQLMLLENF